MAVVQRTGQRLLADLDRMPRYTCVQTIMRTYFNARPKSPGPACSALIAAHDAREHDPLTTSWDRLRLEVALAEGTNVYSWVGAPRFTSDTVDKLAGNGPLGSGDFGIFISEILLKTTLEFQREQVVQGKRLLEYSYAMPVEKSTYKIKTSAGWTLTAYSGTLLLDPEVADLVKLTVRTAVLPASSFACQATTEITYGRTSIHDRLVLIPSDTRLNIISLSGSESLSQTSFANCREYTSTFRMLLDVPPGTAGSPALASAKAEPVAPLPAGLRFDARILTPIDSDISAAGDPVEGVLRSPMRDKNGTVIAPAGVRLHGRMTNVSWRSGRPSYHQITVRFESVEIDGKKVPLSAVSYPPHIVMMTGGTSAPSVIMMNPDDNSLGGTFFFRQEHLFLKSLDAQWITVSTDAGKDEKGKDTKEKDDK
jgi:hypothetical protein